MSKVLAVDITTRPAQSASREAYRLSSAGRGAIVQRQPDTASASSREEGWLYEVVARLTELARLADNWDSYGARSLQTDAIRSFGEFIQEYRSAIQSTPILALTPEGGIFAEWSSSESELEITFEPDSEPRVYLESLLGGPEIYGPLSEYQNSLVKWLWASSMVP